MVGWYDPPQLLRTGAFVLVSQQFALHADNREIQALDKPHANCADYSTSYLDDIWIDFVADCGDGWNSTYAVASALAKEQLQLTLPNGNDAVLHRGKLLIFGGDLIYPTPTGRGYDDRLLKPYFDAFSQEPKNWPDVWALPGNHDWYDSLSAFRRLFCTEQDFGPWRSRQRMSYFAAKLPHGWWLFGIDVQLLHDIDHRQLEYFRNILKDLGAQDRVILACAEPYWVEYATQPVGTSKFVMSLLQTLRELIGDRLRIAVAGDLHYYQRLSPPDSQRHLVTCGTGGAFLHPTHTANPESFPEGYRLAKSFPDTAQSRRLTRRNIYFLFRNPLFGIVPGFFYLLVAWATGINIGEKFSEVQIRELGRVGNHEFWDAIHIGIHSAILSPIGVAIYAIIFAGFIIFTQSKSQMFRWGAGVLHSLTHVFLGFFIFWGASYICMTVLCLTPKSISQYLVASALIFPTAWIGGSIVMGLYLWIALDIFREHTTESFSALRIQDWKGFLRMQICRNGHLNMYFIGIERVPRRWREREANAIGPRWVSDDGAATPAKVVDYVKIDPL
jgi:Calcineurin-like phosphoesterase